MMFALAPKYIFGPTPKTRIDTLFQRSMLMRARTYPLLNINALRRRFSNPNTSHQHPRRLQNESHLYVPSSSFPPNIVEIRHTVMGHTLHYLCVA